MVSTANSKNNASSLPAQKPIFKPAQPEVKGADRNKTASGVSTTKPPVNVLPAKSITVKENQFLKPQDDKGASERTSAKAASNIRLANNPSVSKDTVAGSKDALGPQDKATKPEKVSYKGQNLSITSFEKMDPAKVDLRGAIIDFTGATPDELKNFKFSFKDLDLENVQFQGRFSGLRFQNVNLKGADFSKAILSGDLKDVNFAGAKLNGTKFESANLKGAKFKDADLNGVNFYNSKFAGPEFAGAKLKGAKFKYGQFGEDYNHNLKTQNFSSFKDVNLTGATFDNVSFSNIDMHGATLGGVTLKDSSFYNTSLAGANLKDLEMKQIKQLDGPLNTDILANADLTGANFNGAVIYGEQLEKVDLSKANLQGATIHSNGHKFSLKNTTLNGVKFEGSLQPESLQGANLKGADMRGVQFLQGYDKEAYKGIQFKGVNLRNASFYHVNLAGASFNGTSLANVNFKSAHFAGPELIGADLNGANFDGAGFGKTPLYEAANLNGVNFKGAKLAGANFYGADFNGAKLGVADLRGANFNGAQLTGADVAGANFVGADLRGANTEGVDFSKSILKGRPFDPNLDNPAPKDTKSYQGVRLTRKELADMNLRGANLQGATLFLEAYDKDTSFDGVDLKGVTIEGKVNGNMLRGAKLEGADFRKADFTAPTDSSYPEISRAYRAKEYEGVNFKGALLSPIQQVSSFEEAAMRYKDAGIKEYQDEKIRTQKLIDEGKTLETEFHSAERPHKVIPDDKVQGVREAFQKSILAADKRVNNPEFISAYEKQIRQAADMYGEKFVADLEQIVKTGGGAEQIRALFKDRPNAENDIAYANALAGGMTQIYDVDKARVAMVMDQARQMVSQSEFKSFRNRLILDKYEDFTKMMIKDQSGLLKVRETVLKAFEDEGVLTKAGIGLAYLTDVGIQNNWSNNLFDLVSGSMNGPKITPSLKISNIADLNKKAKDELTPLQTKMGDPILDIIKMGVLAQKGKLGQSGNPSRSEAETKVGKAWEEHLELRKQAAEKINAYAEYADTVVQNGKLAKDILAASTAIALSIPTGGQSLWFMMATGAVIGGTVKGGFTAIDSATSAKGFDGKATAVDSVIGMYEGAAGGALGKLGSVATPWMTKSAGPVLGFMGDVALHSVGSAGISTIDPLYRNLAEGKPIDPEVLKSRALASGIMAGGIRTGMKLPMGKPPAVYSENPLSINSKPVLYPGSSLQQANSAPLEHSYEWAVSVLMRAITLSAFPKR